MAWSDVIGAIGTIASGIGGAIGGPIGSGIQAAGAIGSGIGQFGATEKSSQQSQQAAQSTSDATNMALAIAGQQARENKAAYDKVMGLIPQETAAYNKETAALGPVPQVDANAVAARANQLLPQYMQTTDYDIESAFTKDMAGLYRGGVDTSTFGIQARAAAGDKAAQAHRAAYNQAYDDAMKYVTSLSDANLKTRNQALTEVLDPYKLAITGYSDIFSRTGSADTALSTALTGAGDLSKQAGTGVQSAALGSSASDLATALKKIFGDTSTPPTYLTQEQVPGADVTGLIPGTPVGGGYAAGY